ncbi:MAG: hypothetical protein TREMPRED_002660 [Tremellales sp. Tagirdzhanova-0007]|nr:MAG: hypothetical protein TREMPRED_002660 [Tremellales sp. Tagirdzhanova-0007]
MVSVDVQTTISPYTQQPICTRPLLTGAELDTVISQASKAQRSWRKVTLDERIAIAERWLAEYEKMTDLMAEDLMLQMGRPISSGKGEINGTLYRARHLIKIARDSLKPVPLTETSNDAMKMMIVKQPLGVIAVISPWNYPHLCLVNSTVPALLAGNAVIIKPAPQTPASGERFMSTFLAAGLPVNLLQVVHLSQEMTLSKFVADPRIEFVAFTGSVIGGRAIQQAASSGKGFKGVGLELGGKDPAYVRADADVAWTAEQLVDGAMFNSGQSCCRVERIYIHSSIYDDFVERFVDIAKDYKLGDPSKAETTLGPVVSIASAARIRKQVKDAIASGAQVLLDEAAFPEAKEGTTLVGPQVLVNTASIWTSPTDPTSLAAFNTLVEDLECGMVYLNRADALEPALPWSGWKDSGRGVSLSTMGYDQLTKPKSVCMRVASQ